MASKSMERTWEKAKHKLPNLAQQREQGLAGIEEKKFTKDKKQKRKYLKGIQNFLRFQNNKSQERPVSFST